MTSSPHPRLVPSVAAVFLLVAGGLGASPDSQAGRYLSAVRGFADTVLEHGRDNFGQRRTPLFADGLHADTLQPVRWQGPDRQWVLCNVASQQPLFRLLDGLTALGEGARYRAAAEEAARFMLEHLRTPNGLLHWGGHAAWDLELEQSVGQGEGMHEVKGQAPYFELMWRVNPDATRRLMEGMWGGHVIDWSTLDYNRHADFRRPARPQWEHEYNDSIGVPFVTDGTHLSFVNVTPSLLHAGVMLTTLDGNAQALRWTRRLIHRWQEARHPLTGLSGGQLSYRKVDRAQHALGHVHPEINEARIVATYHQTSRYHYLPLAQMHAAMNLPAKPDGAAFARQLIEWAAGDLKTYAAYCYDPRNGVFRAVTTDGTPLQGAKAVAGYYNADSFAPARPDGFIVWAYALAYRLTRDRAHWDMVRQLAERMNLGTVGEPDGTGRRLERGTRQSEWPLIYALRELHEATNAAEFLQLACRLADNLLQLQSGTGLFPRAGREFARTGDEVPLALLHLAAALQGKSAILPRPIYDMRFFHCEYHGPLEKHQEKRNDKRTYDHLVFYGERS